MKRSAALGMGVCIILVFSSCKSSESAYKKAYEEVKQQELAEPQTTTPVEEMAPVVNAPIETEVVENVPVGTIYEEKVTVVSGVDGLKDYNVVCGSLGVRVNAENLRNFLDKEGYNVVTVFNADTVMYRVIMSTYADRNSAANACDTFKAKYPNRRDLQGIWPLYRVS